MTTELGTELGTTLGTILSSMEIEGTPTFDASKVYALSAASGTGSYTTSAGGGEAGDAAGFGHILLYFLGLPTGTERILGRFVSGGYTLDRSGTALSATWWATDGGGVQRSIASPYPASFHGRIVPIILRHTGTAIDAQWGHTSQPRPSFALTGYTPSATGLTVSNQATLNPSRNGLMSVLSYRGTPSDAQLLALLDAMRALGDLPAKAAAEALMPGTTVTHRWSLRETLAARGTPVADGDAAPASIPDTVTNASVDAWTKSGSLAVSATSPETYPRTIYGAMGFSATSRLESPAGLLSAATLSVELVVNFTSALASSKHIMSNATGSSVVGGFSLYQSANTLNLYSYGAGALVASASIPAAVTGVPRTVRIEYTGSVWRLFLDGVQQGADNAASYTPSTRALYVGVFGDGTSPSDNITVHTLRTGTFASPSQHFYDLTQDVVANGGPSAGVPATVQDRVGTDHLTRVGTGLVVSQRTERLWSYESTPILYGASGLDLSNFYECAAALGETDGVTSFWAAMLFTVTSQAVASKSRALFTSLSTAPGANSGFALATIGANAVVSMTAYNNGGGAAVSPSTAIAATDVGKMMLFVGVVDVPALRVRGYSKRVEAAGGTTFATYRASTAGMRLGRSYLATDYSPDGVVLWGIAAGLGLPSLAQVQGLFDETQAKERIGSIAGITSLRVDLTQDASANGNVLPATLTDRAGAFNFARTGAVTTATTHSRAFGW